MTTKEDLKLELIDVTKYTSIFQIEKITSGIGTSKFSKYQIDFDKTIGYVRFYGYIGDYDNEKEDIYIYFRLPETAPSMDEFIQLINHCIGSNNPYENSVMFNAKFYEETLAKIYDELFKELSLPFISEEEYSYFKFSNLSFSYNGNLKLEGNWYGTYKKVPALPSLDEFVNEYYININTKKLMLRLKKGNERVEANVDHEKFYDHFVKNNDLENILKAAVVLEDNNK